VHFSVLHCLRVPLAGVMTQASYGLGELLGYDGAAQDLTRAIIRDPLRQRLFFDESVSAISVSLVGLGAAAIKTRLRGIRAHVEGSVASVAPVPFAQIAPRHPPRELGYIAPAVENISGVMRGRIVDEQMSRLASNARLRADHTFMARIDPFTRALWQAMIELGVRPLCGQLLVADRMHRVATAVDVFGATDDGAIVLCEIKTSSNAALSADAAPMRAPADSLANNEYNQQHLVLALTRELVLRRLLPPGTDPGRVRAVILRARPYDTLVETLDACAADVAARHYDALLEPVGEAKKRAVAARLALRRASAELKRRAVAERRAAVALVRATRAEQRRVAAEARATAGVSRAIAVAEVRGRRTRAARASTRRAATDGVDQ